MRWLQWLCWLVFAKQVLTAASTTEPIVDTLDAAPVDTPVPRRRRWQARRRPRRPYPAIDEPAIEPAAALTPRRVPPVDVVLDQLRTPRPTPPAIEDLPVAAPAAAAEHDTAFAAPAAPAAPAEPARDPQRTEMLDDEPLGPGVYSIPING